MKRYKLSPRKIETLDSEPEPLKAILGRFAQPSRKSLIERRLIDLEVEEELSEEITEALKKHSFDNYTPAKKYDCLN